jgi:hypothetical protein
MGATVRLAIALAGRDFSEAADVRRRVAAARSEICIGPGCLMGKHLGHRTFARQLSEGISAAAGLRNEALRRRSSRKLLDLAVP